MKLFLILLTVLFLVPSAFSLEAEEIQASTWKKVVGSLDAGNKTYHSNIRVHTQPEDPKERELIEAVKTDRLDEVKRLVEAGVKADIAFYFRQSFRPEVGGRWDSVKTPILFFAIANGNYEMVEYLVKHGADVNAKAEKSTSIWEKGLRSDLTSTPLCEALANGQSKIAIYLIENGANLEEPYSIDQNENEMHRRSGNYETRSPTQIIQDRIKEYQEVANLIQQKLDEIKTNENKETETHE